MTNLSDLVSRDRFSRRPAFGRTGIVPFLLVMRGIVTLLLAAQQAHALRLPPMITRRHILAAAPVALLAPTPALATDADLLKDLDAAKRTLSALPELIGDQKWDVVRNELRSPAVNALWNTMDSGNTLRKLAKSRGDPEIFDAAEECSRNLRDVDGMVYSNSFSMEGKMAGAGLRGDGSGVGGKSQGEGGGKYRIKEPQALLKAAVASIDTVLALE